MPKVFLALALLGALMPAPALATAQFPDIIFIDGQKHFLYSNPLEKYYGPDNPRPQFRSPNTANWRGYVAVWEIDRGMLYLKEIQAWTDKGEVGLDALFPGHQGRVPATWFSGTLRVPEGKVINYVHMGYLSVHERDLVITLEKGKVVKKEVIDNTKGLNPPKPPTP